MGQPLVTIVISCYNHEQYIVSSIVSALEQTYHPIELLVFDDGSKDGSVALIEALQREHHFSFQVQSNQGLSKTLNKGLAQAKGKYFVPFGSDDIMLPDRIEKQVDYMECHPDMALCGGNIIKIDSDGRTLDKQKVNPPATLSFHDIFLDRKPGIPAPTLFFCAEKLKEIDGFNPDIPLEDLYAQLSLTRKGYTAGFMGDVLAYYRTHPANTYKNLDFMLNSVLDTYAHFRDDPYYEQVKYKFLNSMLLRAAKQNTRFAKKVLAMIPFRHYNKKTWRALPKLIFPKG